MLARGLGAADIAIAIEIGVGNDIGWGRVLAATRGTPPEAPLVPGFPYESLDCYRLAAAVARWTLSAKFPPRCGDLPDQAARAAASIALNIAEAGKGGQAGRNHYRIALGSAGELCAVLDIVELPGGAERQAELRRIGAMLRRLAG